MRLIALFVAAVLSMSCRADEASCGFVQPSRHQTGPKPLTGQLRAVAVKSGVDFFQDRDGLHEETFGYLGFVVTAPSHKWHIVRLETIWGQSCRSTVRLLVFSSDMEYLGQYSDFSARKIEIKGNSIFFADAQKDRGTAIAFSDLGPPDKAWIDGDSFQFYK